MAEDFATVSDAPLAYNGVTYAKLTLADLRSLTANIRKERSEAVEDIIIASRFDPDESYRARQEAVFMPVIDNDLFGYVRSAAGSHAALVLSLKKTISDPAKIEAIIDGLLLRDRTYLALAVAGLIEPIKPKIAVKSKDGGPPAFGDAVEVKEGPLAAA